MLSNSYRYANPSNKAERAYLESLIREDFERCHPGETLEDVKRRASFSKEDKGLLRDWMAMAAKRAAADRATMPSERRRSRRGPHAKILRPEHQVGECVLVEPPPESGSTAPPFWPRGWVRRVPCPDHGPAHVAHVAHSDNPTSVPMSLIGWKSVQRLPQYWAPISRPAKSNAWAATAGAVSHRSKNPNGYRSGNTAS